MQPDTLITSFRTMLNNAPLHGEAESIGASLATPIIIILIAGFVFGMLTGWTLWKK